MSVPSIIFGDDFHNELALMAFQERGKPEHLEKDISEQKRNSIYIVMVLMLRLEPRTH